MTEPEPTALDTELPRDLADVPLAELAADADGALAETLRRIAPHDGSRILLVAASFNSAI